MNIEKIAKMADELREEPKRFLAALNRKMKPQMVPLKDIPGYSEAKKRLFSDGLAAALADDYEAVGGEIGCDKSVREGGPSFIYGAFHLCGARMALERNDTQQFERLLRMANSYINLVPELEA